MCKVLLKIESRNLRKVSLTKLIRNSTQLGLAASKDITDRLLEGEEATIDFPSLEEAEAFRNEAIELGADCKVTHNKAVIPQAQHRQYTNWWRALARALRR